MDGMSRWRNWYQHGDVGSGWLWEEHGVLWTKRRGGWTGVEAAAAVMVVERNVVVVE